MYVYTQLKNQKMIEDPFYTYLLVIACIILIIMLTYLGITLSYSNTKQSFPPISATCPDYWDVITDSNGVVGCKIPNRGDKNYGSGTYPSTTRGYTVYNGKKLINFNDIAWTNNGNGAICNKQKWAIQNKIEWDGVTNFNGC